MQRIVKVFAALAAPTDRWFSALLVAAGAIALGYGLQISNGTVNKEAMALLTFTLAAAALALLSPKLSLLERLGDTPIMAVLAVGLGVGVSVHLTTPPGSYLRVSGDGYVAHHRWVVAIAILAGAGLARKPWAGTLRMLALLGAMFGLGLWLLKASPSPFIDVWVWHNEAFAALLKGTSPYAITMPNIYGTTEWFGPGLADATRVFVGYPYPPLTMALGGLGHAIAGDYRYANLAALIASAALIAASRPGRVASTAAVILLLSPRSLFVLEQGWTESSAILAFSAVVFCGCRAPRLLPWVFGAMLATKQYFVLCLPLVFLLLPRPLTWKGFFGFAWRSAVIPVVTILPFLVWSPKGFIDSVGMFQVRQPFRPDSLTFLTATMKNGVPGLPQWAGFAALVPAYLLGVVRAPRTPFGFAVASALTFGVFFAFAKQAFCNYYFLVVAILCCAAAAAKPDQLD